MKREEVIGRIERELVVFMGPLARVVMKDKAAELGKTIEDFPEEKLAELVEEASFEIKNNRRKVEFQRAALEILRQVSPPPVARKQSIGLKVKRGEQG